MSTRPEDAVRALRAATSGHLRPDPDTARPVRYVLDRRRGGLLFQLPRDFEDITSAQLLVPDEHDPVLAALLEIRPVPRPAPEVEIRHEVYHGPLREGPWAVGTVEALRYHTEAFDAEEFGLTDAIVDAEPEICRELNADPQTLRRICRRVAEIADPVAVGVDPDGLDVRARFGTVRVEFSRSAATPDEARARIAELAGPEPSEAGGSR